MFSKKHLFLVGSICDSLTISLIAAWCAEAFLDRRIPIVGDSIGLVLSHNKGIAFGFHLGHFQDFLIILALVLVVVLAIHTAKHWLEQTGFGLIIGGGLANLIDRMIDGKVTDMIQVGSFPIFNVADMCINIGIALLIVHALAAKRAKS